MIVHNVLVAKEADEKRTLDLKKEECKSTTTSTTTTTSTSTTTTTTTTGHGPHLS